MDLFNLKKVLVVGAHADDEVLGIGGTISRLTNQGIQVDVLIVTDSTSSQYQSHQNLSEIDENRRSGLELSCETLGVHTVHQFNFPDMRLDQVAHVELNRSISQVINSGNYDTIFVHHHSDVNLDHQMVFKSVMVCTRPMPNSSIKNVFCYYTPSSTEWGSYSESSAFIPNVFVDISHHLDTKLKAFEVYTDEIREYPHPRSSDNLVSVAKFFGSSVGLDAAEPFVLVRHICK
ncbi:PIG-L deacetylase family protein [Vibrio diabolicus]|uniref:PIG-L deacetylase family protein n=1 Tax=Vibrio diabolicus TaxID=50719 RepID=UPI0015F43680|nr:PIG-L deacetylase family protein [Vibrio diabolicus]